MNWKHTEARWTHLRVMAFTILPQKTSEHFFCQRGYITRDPILCIISKRTPWCPEECLRRNTGLCLSMAFYGDVSKWHPWESERRWGEGRERPDRREKPSHQPFNHYWTEMCCPVEEPTSSLIPFLPFISIAVFLVLSSSLFSALLRQLERQLELYWDSCWDSWRERQWKAY